MLSTRTAWLPTTRVGHSMSVVTSSVRICVVAPIEGDIAASAVSASGASWWRARRSASWMRTRCGARPGSARRKASSLSDPSARSAPVTHAVALPTWPHTARAWPLRSWWRGLRLSVLASALA